MDDRNAWAERVRRWGWEAVALVPPGLWMAVVYGGVVVRREGPLDGLRFTIILLLAAPLLLGARMIWAGTDWSLPGRSIRRVR